MSEGATVEEKIDNLKTILPTGWSKLNDFIEILLLPGEIDREWLAFLTPKVVGMD